MALELARGAVAALGVYVAAGVLFALWFVLRGVPRVDRDAQDGSLGFRILIFPASVALWPLLLARSIRGGGEAPPECNAHRRAASEGRK